MPCLPVETSTLVRLEMSVAVAVVEVAGVEVEAGVLDRDRARDPGLGIDHDKDPGLEIDHDKDQGPEIEFALGIDRIQDRTHAVDQDPNPCHA